MNEVPFFLGERSVPDRQPINRQLSGQPSGPFRVDSAQHDVSAYLRDHCMIGAHVIRGLQHIVNVQLGSNVFLVDCLWEKQWKVFWIIWSATSA